MLNTTIYARLIARLRAVRIELDVSQKELGVRMGLPDDVASARISRYETGERRADVDSLKDWAKHLGVPLPAPFFEDEKLAELFLYVLGLDEADREPLYQSARDKVGPARAAEVQNVVKTMFAAKPTFDQRLAEKEAKAIKKATRPAGGGPKKGKKNR